MKVSCGLSFYRDQNGRITGIRAEYMRDRKRKYLGKFPNFEEAKKAYDDQVNGVEDNGGNIDE